MVNPLNPKSIQHLVSPNNIGASSRESVMRFHKMVSKVKMLSSSIKFCQLIFLSKCMETSLDKLYVDIGAERVEIYKQDIGYLLSTIAWESSGYFMMPPLVSLRNDVLETSAETSQIWAVFLIGRAAWKICFNQTEAQPRSVKWHLVSKMEPRYNEPLCNEVPGIMNNFVYPSNCKIYRKEPCYE